ncbi:MAG: hypothetical protein ABSH12_07080 [Endomicrobiales bacterium]|jgi:hypothetical protein
MKIIAFTILLSSLAINIVVVCVVQRAVFSMAQSGSIVFPVQQVLDNLDAPFMVVDFSIGQSISSHTAFPKQTSAGVVLL